MKEGLLKRETRVSSESMVCRWGGLNKRRVQPEMNVCCGVHVFGWWSISACVCSVSSAACVLLLTAACIVVDGATMKDLHA